MKSLCGILYDGFDSYPILIVLLFEMKYIYHTDINHIDLSSNCLIKSGQTAEHPTVLIPEGGNPAGVPDGKDPYPVWVPENAQVHE